MSTRGGGVSAAPWHALNLGLAVGDDRVAVAENRRRLAAAADGIAGVDAMVWLRQVHGARVVQVVDALDDEPPEADGAWTDRAGVALAIQVADCLPVLFAAPGGRAVAAAHAGWRGLAAGVLDATVAALCDGAGCRPRELQAWLGPCIGPHRFEVGADVVQAFGGGAGDAAGDAAADVADDAAGDAASDRQPASRFRVGPPHAADGTPRWFADLPGLARDRLARLGVARVDGGRWCTVSDPSRWFSYRRDGVTGRLAALVWRRRLGA
ncbi:MAG: peptidoglycan editing factor PgeF [Rubrivivax sp.]